MKTTKIVHYIPGGSIGGEHLSLLDTDVSREGRGYWNLETEKAMKKVSPYRICDFQKRDTASLKPPCRKGDRRIIPQPPLPSPLQQVPPID